MADEPSVLESRAKYQSKMGHFRTVVMAIVLSSLFGHSQAACSPCPFQWREHQHHCYQYFRTALPYDQAEEYCRRQHARRYTGGLASIDSMDEMQFLIDFVGYFINGSVILDTPKYVWLHTVDKSYENYNLMYYRALNAMDESENFFAACNALSPAYEATLSATLAGNSYLVPAPEVVEQKCAIYAGEGAYLDLGDFAGTCISDPDICPSETLTWSVWMKINTAAMNSVSYFLCTGGYTYRGRGVFLNYKVSQDTFNFGARSKRRSWSIERQYTGAKVPTDVWFHLAATVDLRPATPILLVYANAVLLTEDSRMEPSASTNDGCTKLILGTRTPCADVTPSSDTHGGSAAYSNLMAFDYLFTSEQIANLHSCGSLDWDLKVRNLHLDPASVNSANLRYVCKASASTGPTIHWNVYHANQVRWEYLHLSSGPVVDITPTSFSTCVVESVLLIDSSRWPNSERDIISCTAISNSQNASVYIKGNWTSIGYSDHDNAGYFILSGGVQHYQSDLANETENSLGNNLFFCEKERII